MTLGSTRSDREEIKDIVLYHVLPGSAAVRLARAAPALPPELHLRSIRRTAMLQDMHWHHRRHEAAGATQHGTSWHSAQVLLRTSSVRSQIFHLRTRQTPPAAEAKDPIEALEGGPTASHGLTRHQAVSGRAQSMPLRAQPHSPGAAAQGAGHAARRRLADGHAAAAAAAGGASSTAMVRSIRILIASMRLPGVFFSRRIAFRPAYVYQTVHCSDCAAGSAVRAHCIIVSEYSDARC